jgi:hypothetical protein
MSREASGYIPLNNLDAAYVSQTAPDPDWGWDNPYPEQQRTKPEAAPSADWAKAENIADTSNEHAVDAGKATEQLELFWEEIGPWLTPRELRVMYLYDAQGLTQLTVAARLGVTKQDVSQIRLRAIQNLQSNPFIIHTFGLPVICNPYFPYLDRWKSNEPCPVNKLPKSEAVRIQNGIVYEKHRPALEPEQVAWLPEALQTEARNRS